MCRTRNASKLQESTHTLDSTNPSVGRVELEPKSNDPSSERVESQPKMIANSAKSSSKRIARKTIGSVRRSERLQNVVIPAQNLDVERVIQEITLSESEKSLSESEKEDEQLDGEVPEPTSPAKNLEEKLDYLLHLLEAQQKAIDTLKSKATKKALFIESSGVGDITYKSLYFDSQKKVEALVEENHQLTKKLENSLGKIEAYEKGNLVISEVLDKLKNVILLLSSLTRPTETAVNVSSEVVRDAFATVDTGFEGVAFAKRKRLDKVTEKN